MALVREQGADMAVNHSQPGYLDALREALGAGPDLILEMLANVNLAADMALAGMRGRIVVIGNRGEVTINPRMAMAKELDICGMMLWNHDEAQLSAALDEISGRGRGGALRPVVGAEMKLSEAAAAQVAVLGNGNLGKIVLVP